MTGFAIITFMAVYFGGQVSPRQTMIVVIIILALVLLSPFVRELQNITVNPVECR